jgi:hypothetical protein
MAAAASYRGLRVALSSPSARLYSQERGFASTPAELRSQMLALHHIRLNILFLDGFFIGDFLTVLTQIQ